MGEPSARRGGGSVAWRAIGRGHNRQQGGIMGRMRVIGRGGTGQYGRP